MKTGFILASIVLLAAAQATAGQPLALKNAVQLALEKNNLVKAAVSGAAAADIGVDIVRSRYYPVISFEETFAASNSPSQAFMMKLDQGVLHRATFRPAASITPPSGMISKQRFHSGSRCMSRLSPRRKRWPAKMRRRAA